jgi:hypothetical protein
MGRAYETGSNVVEERGANSIGAYTELLLEGSIGEPSA